MLHNNVQIFTFVSSKTNSFFKVFSFSVSTMIISLACIFWDFTNFRTQEQKDRFLKKNLFKNVSLLDKDVLSGMISACLTSAATTFVFVGASDQTTVYRQTESFIL